MYQRKLFPIGNCPSDLVLEFDEAYRPFRHDDLPGFWEAAFPDPRRRPASLPGPETPSSRSPRIGGRTWPSYALSRAALWWMFERRLEPPVPRGSRLGRLKAIQASAAALLRQLEAPDLDQIFAPDIGHQDSVRRAGGFTGSEEFGWLKEFAHEVRALLIDRADFRRELRIIHAAATGEIVRVGESPKRRGPSVNATRHRFVLHVLSVFDAFCGSNGSVTHDWEGGERTGPRPRFFAAVCACLAERLLPEECNADPQLEEVLRVASVETGAGQWVEEALIFRRDQDT